MAKQHFYSRVPARASMYNRCDGFDTFAHSEGLEQSFVQEELAAVCENKLFKTAGKVYFVAVAVLMYYFLTCHTHYRIHPSTLLYLL